MTTVPRTSRVRGPRAPAGKVPRQRRPVDRSSADDGRGVGPRAWPGWPDSPDPGSERVLDRVLHAVPDAVPDDVPDDVAQAVPEEAPGEVGGATLEAVPPTVAVAVPRRLIPEPRLARTGAAAVLGMLLMAALLGTVGGFALLWLATRMLVYLR